MVKRPGLPAAGAGAELVLAAALASAGPVDGRGACGAQPARRSASASSAVQVGHPIDIRSRSLDVLSLRPSHHLRSSLARPGGEGPVPALHSEQPTLPT